MEKVLLEKGLREEWARCLLESDDAWFWHTAEYMDFCIELSGRKFRSSISFFIRDNNQIEAVCPVLIEESNLGSRAVNCFSYASGPLPPPAIKAGVSPVKRRKILDFYIESLRDAASANNVGYLSVRISSLAKRYINSGMPSANPFLKYGFTDLAYETQVIDLRKDAEALWQGIRKGHKADIQKFSKTMKTVIYDAGSITPEIFKSYQELHLKDAGRVTRSQKTFDMMLGWIKNGFAVLAEAKEKENTVGFALILTYKEGAYYGSSCKDPDLAHLSASHLIQWDVINYLKKKGLKFYDIGLQFYGPQWFFAPNEKDLSIAKFKRGFGGEPVRLIAAELFFSKELMRDIYLERMNVNCGLNFKG